MGAHPSVGPIIPERLAVGLGVRSAAPPCSQGAASRRTPRRGAQCSNQFISSTLYLDSKARVLREGSSRPPSKRAQSYRSKLVTGNQDSQAPSHRNEAIDPLDLCKPSSTQEKAPR